MVAISVYILKQKTYGFKVADQFQESNKHMNTLFKKDGGNQLQKWQTSAKKAIYGYNATHKCRPQANSVIDIHKTNNQNLNAEFPNGFQCTRDTYILISNL